MNRSDGPRRRLTPLRATARSLAFALGCALLILAGPAPAHSQTPLFIPQERSFEGLDPCAMPECLPWELQLLPDGLLYRSYLAGPKEPRFGYAWLYDTHSKTWVNDATLGGRVGILRLGTDDPIVPSGYELDLEGAAMPRLNGSHDLDLTSADFRVGVPITWREGPWQAKLAWYHVSSHVGDEYLVSHPSYQRINYRRDAFVLGGGFFPMPDLRLYAEVGYAFITDGGARPWELQFGWEYAPNYPTGLGSAPFIAMNAYLRQEVDWGGDFALMAGWAWRGKHLLRAGLQYTLSETTQWQFLGQSEQTIGLGLWYDF